MHQRKALNYITVSFFSPVELLSIDYVRVIVLGLHVFLHASYALLSVQVLSLQGEGGSQVFRGGGTQNGY